MPVKFGKSPVNLLAAKYLEIPGRWILCSYKLQKSNIITPILLYLQLLDGGEVVEVSGNSTA